MTGVLQCWPTRPALAPPPPGNASVAKQAGVASLDQVLEKFRAPAMDGMCPR